MVIFKRYQVPVAALQRHVDPLGGWLWGCTLISVSEIMAAVAAQQFEIEPWDQAKERLQGSTGREFHVRRIATFVANGLPSDSYAVQINLDRQPDDREIGIVNGNHRIAAAILRGDAYIEATVYFFDPADVDRLLPGSIEL
jgi:hypothetical protein